MNDEARALRRYLTLLESKLTSDSQVDRREARLALRRLVLVTVSILQTAVSEAELLEERLLGLGALLHPDTGSSLIVASVSYMMEFERLEYRKSSGTRPKKGGPSLTD